MLKFNCVTPNNTAINRFRPLGFLRRMKERALVATYLDFVWCLLFWIQAEGVANDAYQIKSYWTLTFFVGGSTLEILEGRGEWEDWK